MTTPLSRGFRTFINCCRNTHNRHHTSTLSLFNKYLEVHCNCDENDIEVPCFAVKTISDYTVLKNTECSFIIPIVQDNDYITVTTANAFFAACEPYKDDFKTVVLKDKKYKIGKGIVVDKDDNIIMLSTAIIKRDSLGTSSPVIHAHKIYISISVLENIKNTVEKAIMQKIVPCIVKNNYMQVCITDKMPFEKKVKNNFNNNNFNVECYEAIKETSKQYV